MKTIKATDLPLRAGVEGGQLVISIGIGTLAWASKKRNGGPISDKCSIIDKPQWATDVANSLCREDEVGNSALTQLFDKMMEDAANRGSTGIMWPAERKKLKRR